MKCSWMVVSLLYTFKNYMPTVEGAFNLFLTKFELCNSTYNYRHKLYATFRTAGNQQYADGNATLRIPIDDNLKAKFIAELLVGETYIHLVTIEEKHSCKALNNYLGEFMYDLERAAQLMPGLCPIPVGRYHIHNFLLNFNRLTLQSFPFGNIRMNLVTSDTRNEVVCCVNAEAENKAF